MKYDYDNIMSLAKQNDYKKIMIMRNSWSEGNWAIVNKVILNPDKVYGSAYGIIQYKNGKRIVGEIPCAGTYAWRVIGVFTDEIEVIYK